MTKITSRLFVKTKIIFSSSANSTTIQVKEPFALMNKALATHTQGTLLMSNIVLTQATTKYSAQMANALSSNITPTASTIQVNTCAKKIVTIF
jgi:hypothetical protein